MKLLDLALNATKTEFQAEAKAWLHSRIGFDGVVWGSGTLAANGTIQICDFLLDGRPDGLVTDYPACASVDPISERFLAQPSQLQNIATHRFYRASALSSFRQYLDHYRVRQLQLVGMHHPLTGGYGWMVFYREEGNRPFVAENEAMTDASVKAVLMAEHFHRSAHASRTLITSSQRASTATTVISHLTCRQRTVLEYLERGLPNKLIAYQLAISENTLKSHLKVVFRVLGAKSRIQAIIKARELFF